VLRRTVLVTVAVLGVALALAAAAFAATVKVRVEGRTQTIFGAAQPNVQADNALSALEAASVTGEFYYLVTAADFGNYVSQIGRYPAAGNAGWAFKVNGVSPPVGADQVQVRDGDTVLWYWAEFGPSGGPRTLDLRRLPANCYLVSTVDDQGVRRAAAGATLTVDGRRVRTTANGRGCVGRHTGLVKATLAGAVRSNAVR
jgi:Domain of unknown function (DUF4430)